MTPTFATLFSGGCVADVGIQRAGYRHLWGVELDDDIANVARANGFHVITADVLTVDPRTLEAPYYLHASPVCTRASRANQTAEENEDGTREAPLDIDMAAKVCEFLDVMKPPAFTLENVYGYREFKSFKMICNALSRLGYMWDYAHLNSADYGVPQTRRRLILRARLGALLRPLPEPVAWVGWYAAIEDLIPTLPDSQFAPWQLARLPDEQKSFLMPTPDFETWYSKTKEYGGTREEWERLQTGNNPRSFLMPNENTSSAVVRDGNEPSATVGAVQRVGNRPRAFIVDGQSNSHSTSVTVRDEVEPAITATASMDKRPQRAFIVSHLEQVSTIRDINPNFDKPYSTVVSGEFRRHSQVAKAQLENGRVVKMTARALARFQSIPDSYQLPAKDALAARIIGNGYPSLMAEKVAETLLP